MAERPFRSTVPYYVSHRPRYPAELIGLLAEEVGLGSESRVLDLGTGPGHVAIPLAAYAREVVAVDVEPEMLAALAESAPANVRPVEARAEDVDASWGSFDLVTAGRSFHWFDEAVVMQRLAEVTPALALLGDHGLGAQRKVVAIARELLGEDPVERRSWQFREVLQRSPFSEVTELAVEVERAWTHDDLLLLAYSLSVASVERLGDLRQEFERRVRAELPAVVHERVTVDALVGRRPY
jgi:SAM-dependent methyltransferase